jgi:hypothetical protein
MASCYENTACLTINGGTPSTGRKQLAATAASYMKAIPDLQVSVEQVLVAEDSAFWVRWTLIGTNTFRCDQLDLTALSMGRHATICARMADQLSLAVLMSRCFGCFVAMFRP